MLCVACGQMTTGDFSVPCELCGRMQIVGEKYVLVHMVELVGHVRTYSAIRMKDEAPFTCTLWPLPKGVHSESNLVKVKEGLQAINGTDGCIPMQDLYLSDGPNELLIDIRHREGMMWLMPTQDGELWDLDTIQEWLDSMATMASALHPSEDETVTPCFRIGRLLLEKETRKICTIDPGYVRAHLYSEFSVEKEQLPILRRLNLDHFWHSWAATAIQLLGGTSVYGLRLLHEACSELEQNTLLDLLEGVVQDKKDGVETTNPFRLEALRNLLVDCATRYANRAPTAATQPVEKWTPPTFVRRTSPQRNSTTSKVTTAPLETTQVKQTAPSPTTTDATQTVPDAGAPDPSPPAPSNVEPIQAPPDLRKLQAMKIQRAKVRRRRKIADGLMLMGISLLFLGWPVLAWQWSFSESNNLEDSAGRQAALESVLKQVALNPEFVSCLSAAQAGAVVTLRWNGDVRPNLRAFTNGGVRNNRMTTCLESAVVQAALKWNVPLSGPHETIIAWELEVPEE